MALAAIDRFSHARVVDVIVDVEGDAPVGKSTVRLTQAPGGTVHTERGGCNNLPSCTPLIFGVVPATLTTVPTANAPTGAIEIDPNGARWSGWAGPGWHIDIDIDAAGDPIETGTTCGSHCDF